MRAFGEGARKEKLFSLYTAIEPQLYKYPAIDPRSFAEAVRRFVES